MRPDGLAARALEPVLQLAVLEVLEVERGRVLHQADAGGVGEALGEQRVEQRDDAAEHVGEHGQRRARAPSSQARRSSEAAGQPVAQASPARAGGRARRDDLVDDQLADVERGHRQQRAHQAQQRGRPTVSAAAGLPDQLAGTAAGCAARRSARAAIAAARRLWRPGRSGAAPRAIDPRHVHL